MEPDRCSTLLDSGVGTILEDGVDRMLVKPGEVAAVCTEAARRARRARTRDARPKLRVTACLDGSVRQSGVARAVNWMTNGYFGEGTIVAWRGIRLGGTTYGNPGPPGNVGAVWALLRDTVDCVVLDV